MSAANDIPHDNPILSAIESWKERTPLLTRYLLTSQVISYAASWFIDGTLALSNIPHFTLIKFEIYRLFSSLLVNTSVFSILFAVMSVGEFSKRLEYSMGSAAFGWLCFLLGLGSNTMFLLITWLLSYLDPTWMLASASGMWMIYYGVLAVACAQAPAELRIRLCVVQVPVMYFPLALLVLMSIMGGGGHSLGNLTSLLLGYAVGNGYLGAVQLSSARAKHWEDSVLASLTQRDGWVYGHAATGSEGGWKDTEDGAMVCLLDGSQERSDKTGLLTHDFFPMVTVAPALPRNSQPARRSATS